MHERWCMLDPLASRREHSIGLLIAADAGSLSHIQTPGRSYPSGISEFCRGSTSESHQDLQAIRAQWRQQSQQRRQPRSHWRTLCDSMPRRIRRAVRLATSSWEPSTQGRRLSRCIGPEQRADARVVGCGMSRAGDGDTPGRSQPVEALVRNSLVTRWVGPLAAARPALPKRRQGYFL